MIGCVTVPLYNFLYFYTFVRPKKIAVESCLRTWYDNSISEKKGLNAPDGSERC